MGSYTSEFGGDPDEAGHYMTGLLVHDYIAAGWPTKPMQYARDYYTRYPKVGLGHWPPVFYVAQAVWELPFGASRVSLMVFMAALTALAGTVLFCGVRRESMVSVALVTSLYFLSLPIVLRYTQMVMAEMLLTALVTLAVWEYGRYLDSERWQSAALFGLWAAAAVMTKGTGMVLAFVPLIGVVLSRRWGLLQRFSFWTPALVVIALAGPWYLWAPGAQHEAVARFGGLVTVIGSRVMGTLLVWKNMMGTLPTILAVAGFVVVCRRLVERNASGVWCAGIALLVGTYAMRLGVGAWEDRHLLTCVPVLLMLAVKGVFLIPRKFRSVTGAGLALILIVMNLQSIPKKHHYGYSETAQALLSDSSLRNSVFLSCAGATGEGMLISEVAMRESRPGHIVLRASKMLADTDWMSYRYELRFRSPQAVMQYLESLPAGIVVMDGEGRRTPHGELLMQGLQQDHEKWTLTAQYGADGDIAVYRLKGHEGRVVDKKAIPVEPGIFSKRD